MADILQYYMLIFSMFRFESFKRLLELYKGVNNESALVISHSVGRGLITDCRFSLKRNWQRCEAECESQYE